MPGGKQPPCDLCLLFSCLCRLCSLTFLCGLINWPPLPVPLSTAISLKVALRMGLCILLFTLSVAKLRCRDEGMALELWPDSMPKTRTQGFLIPNRVKYQLLFSLHLSFIVSSVNQAPWPYHSIGCQTPALNTPYMGCQDSQNKNLK